MGLASRAEELARITSASRSLTSHRHWRFPAQANHQCAREQRGAAAQTGMLTPCGVWPVVRTSQPRSCGTCGRRETHLNVLQRKVLGMCSSMNLELRLDPRDQAKESPDGGHDGVHVEVDVVAFEGSAYQHGMKTTRG